MFHSRYQCLKESRLQFISAVRGKVWDNFHRKYTKNMHIVVELTGSPANAFWLCLEIFQKHVSLNYHMTQSSPAIQPPDLTEDEQDIVNYIGVGGSVLYKIKQRIYQNN